MSQWNALRVLEVKEIIAQRGQGRGQNVIHEGMNAPSRTQGLTFGSVQNGRPPQHHSLWSRPEAEGETIPAFKNLRSVVHSNPLKCFIP